MMFHVVVAGCCVWSRRVRKAFVSILPLRVWRRSWASEKHSYRRSAEQLRDATSASISALFPISFAFSLPARRSLFCAVVLLWMLQSSCTKAPTATTATATGCRRSWWLSPLEGIAGEHADLTASPSTSRPADSTSARADGDEVASNLAAKVRNWGSERNSIKEHMRYIVSEGKKNAKRSARCKANSEDCWVTVESEWDACRLA